MKDALKSRLLKAAGGGALAIALALGAWYEGTGPTRKMPDGSVQYGAYRDPGGIWTACRGVTGPGVVPNAWYTQAQCDAMEGKAYAEAVTSARRLFLLFGSYNQWMQAALIDMVYNLGESKLQGSTIQRKLNSGDEIGGCDEMSRWVNGRVKGVLVPLPGLVDRRGTSEELCMHWGRPS